MTVQQKVQDDISEKNKFKAGYILHWCKVHVCCHLVSKTTLHKFHCAMGTKKGPVSIFQQEWLLKRFSSGFVLWWKWKQNVLVTHSGFGEQEYSDVFLPNSLLHNLLSNAGWGGALGVRAYLIFNALNTDTYL